MASEFVSADGSPLAMYLALPAGKAPLIVHSAIPPGSTILELGCGPGRITRVLVALGHTVTAVDDSEEMLEHVTGAAGPVSMTFVPGDLAGSVRSASMTYSLAEWSWQQTFRTEDVDDAKLAQAAAAAGLAIDRTLTDDQRWLTLTVDDSGGD